MFGETATAYNRKVAYGLKNIALLCKSATIKIKIKMKLLNLNTTL